VSGPVTAGGSPDPLPSELLEPSGVAAWVIRPADLDRLGVLTTAPRVLTADGRDPDEPELPAPGCAHDDTVDGPASPPSGPQSNELPPLHRLDPLGRYRPDSDGCWPEDAVTLTYTELRRLVALHLDLARQGMPNTNPWGWVKQRARATLDGEIPILVSEVLDT
jgi:hypothetical protein